MSPRFSVIAYCACACQYNDDASEEYATAEAVIVNRVPSSRNPLLASGSSGSGSDQELGLEQKDKAATVAVAVKIAKCRPCISISFRISGFTISSLRP